MFDMCNIFFVCVWKLSSPHIDHYALSKAKGLREKYKSEQQKPKARAFTADNVISTCELHK